MCSNSEARELVGCIGDATNILIDISTLCYTILFSSSEAMNFELTAVMVNFIKEM